MNMNRKILTLAACVCCFVGALFGQAQVPAKVKASPAFIDVDTALDLTANPPTVNISLPRFLILNATSDLGEQFTEIADITKELEFVRVLVIEGKKQDDTTKLTEGAKALRQQLRQGWMPIVNVNDGEEFVGIFALADESGEKMAGMAGLITEGGGDLVYFNLVGNVPLNKVIQLAGKMDDPKLQEALGKLQNGALTGNIPAAPETPKSDKK